MKLKSKVDVTLVVATAMVTVVSLLLFQEFQRVNRAVAANSAINEAVKGVYELNTLAGDFQLRRSERASEQWLARHSSLARILDSLDASPAVPVPTEDMSHLRSYFADLQTLFLRLTRLLETEGGRPNSTASVLEQAARIEGQLNVKTQAVLSGMLALAETSQQTVLASQKRQGILFAVGAVLFLLTVGVGGVAFRRAVLTPLLHVCQGANLFAAGNLAHRIQVQVRDEIGDLAGDFNRMADSLGKSFQSMAIEITERKRAEQGLHESEARLRLLIEGVTDYAIYLLDTGGHVVSWNAGAERLKGYGAEETIGQHYSRFFTPEDQQDNKPLRLLAAAESLGRIEDEGWRVRKDGSSFWGNVVMTALHREDGSLYGFAKITRDLTERKRAEEAMRETKEYLENLINNANAPIIVWNPQLRITRFNHAFESLTGRNAGDVIGQSLEFLFPPALVQSSMELIKKTLVGERWETVELSILRADGSIRTLLWNSATILGADSKVPVAVIAQGQDITERKQAEQERETTIEFLRLANASTGTRELIQAVACFFQHKSGCQAVGIRLREGDDYPYYEARGFPKEFVQMENTLCARGRTGEVIRDSAGNPLLECMCGNVICGRFDPSKPFFTPTGSFWTNSTTQLLATTSEADRQARTRNRCNGEGYESVALIPVRLGKERLGLLQLNDPRKELFTPEVIAQWERLADQLAVALARFRAEEALRESEARLQTIVENLGEGVAVSDLDGQLLHFNRAALDLHGFASLDECRRHLTEFADTFELSAMSGMVWPVDQWPLARILRGENLRDLEVRIRHTQAEWQRVYSYGGTLVRDAGGQPMMAVVTISDITDRKRAEEEIRTLNVELEQRVTQRTAQLAAANRELEAFSYSVSHDLRAPLRSIDGFSQALLEDYADTLDAEGKGYLQRVRAATARMGDLIEALLTLSRVTRREVRRTTVDLSALARAVADELQQREPGRPAEVVIADGLVAEADPRLVRAVLENLLGNAWKFTAGRPVARIEFGTVANCQFPVCDLKAPAGETKSQIGNRKSEMVFFVRDNGVGFDMAYAEKLYGAFQRLHSQTEFKGAGIGLATVRRIIHRHGGRTWAEGAIDRGATFYFTIG